MAQWYYTAKGQRLGPVSDEQLKELATTGQLKSSDLVWKNGMEKWTPAGAIRGLLPETQKNDVPPPLGSGTAQQGGIPVFKKDPVIVLVLGIVTCGLYLIYWNIKAAEVLNAVAGRDIISAPVAVMSGCCVPLNIYFYYLCGQALADLGKAIGKENELKGKSTLLLLLGIFFPMVAAMIVQGHINELYD